MTKVDPSKEEDLSWMVERLIDANLNRLKEGLRVIEDVCRYIHNDKVLTSTIKEIRHSLQLAYKLERLLHRDIEADIQKQSTSSEQLREDIKDIIIANFSRSEESSRVLEEILKLNNIKQSERFKAIRYNLYSLEKEYFTKYLQS